MLRAPARPPASRRAAARLAAALSLAGPVPSGPVRGGTVRGRPVRDGPDERGEQARVAALLRVPLHAEHEARESVEFRRPGLDRLDRAVFLPGHRLEPVTEQVDRLMVVRGHVKEAILGQDRGQRAVRADPHLMQAEPVRRPVVSPVAHQVGQVLVQRPASADVQHLHAAADGEQRHAQPQRVAGDVQVPGVAQRCGSLRPRVPRRAVPDRVDVRTARDHQAVQARDRGPGLFVVATRRQHHRPSAAAPHRVHIDVRKHRRPGRPAAPGRLILVCGNANNRRHSSPLNFSSVARYPENTGKPQSFRTDRGSCSPSVPADRVADGTAGGGVGSEVSSCSSVFPEEH